MAQIESAWQERHPYAERGFIQGRLSQDGSARGELLMLSRGDALEGFAVVWNAAGKEAVIDVARLSQRAEEAGAHALLRALFAAAIAHARASGARRLRLGLIPPEGLNELLLAPALKHAGPGFWSHGGHFDDAAALRAFMLSFGARTRPRYIATAGGIALSNAVIDAATLMTGHPPPRRPRFELRS